MYMVNFEHQNSAYGFPIGYHLQIGASVFANSVQILSLLIQNHRHDFHSVVAPQDGASVHQVYQFELDRNHAEAG